MIKKAVSLPEHIYEGAKEKAQKYFGGNFSGYVCYVISKDLEESQTKPRRQKDEKVIAIIDEIMNI